MEKIIVFGTGVFGKNFYKINNSIYDIKYFCDNNLKKQNTLLNNIKIINPLELKKVVFDKIYIASSYAEEIYAQLVTELNIEPSKIVKLYVNESNVQFLSDRAKENAEHFMFYICELLTKNSIPYYIDHGTLLGIVRDNALIPWDKDIDIAVSSKYIERIVQILNSILMNYKHPLCKENNWVYTIEKDYLVINKKKEYVCVELQIRNDVSTPDEMVALDLMPKYQENNFLIWGVCKKKLSVLENICFPSKKLMYKDRIIHIPREEKEYLTQLFGNWRIPIKQWSYDNYTNTSEE